MTRLPARNSRAGFSLVELMIGLVIMSFIMGTTVAVFRSQSANFRKGGERLELSQNGRYALATVDRMLRTAGAGVSSAQPMFIYGANDVLAFNSNYTSDVPDNCAVNTNPDAPAGSVDIMTTAQAAVIPNSSPAFTYPSMTYTTTGCRAETIVFYLRPDSTTSVTTDYMLLVKVNGMAPELVANNLEAYPGRNFFEYFVHRVTLAANDSLVLAGASGSGVTLPIKHDIAIHGSAGDTVGTNSAIADSVTMIRMNVRVTNGMTGADQRYEDMSTGIKLPNNGLIQLQSCGDAPLFISGGLSVTANIAGNPPAITLTWPASVDETSGQTDVTQYNIYRRYQSDPSWADAYTAVPAGGVASYTFTDGGVIRDSSYVYAVTAQDCNPTESTKLVSGNIHPN